MIQDFDTFNENISDIFKSAHGALDPDDLIPLKSLIGKPKFPSKKEFEDIVEFTKGNPDNFFYNPNDFLNTVIYWEGPIFYGFPGMISLELVKMMRTDRGIERIREELENANKTKDFNRIFMLADKKILFPLFTELYDKIPDNKKYDIFIDLYVRSEYGFEKIPKNILQDCIEKRKFSTKWRKRMNLLKSKAKNGKITVYRGVASGSRGEEALSWTTDKKVAEFFKNRFSTNGKILKKEVSLDRVIDFLRDRGESEVLII